MGGIGRNHNVRIAKVEVLVNRKLGFASFASHLRSNGTKSGVKLEDCK
jgi:hypothetical protein